MRLALALVTLAGCGRVGFDDHPRDAGAGTDATTDAPAGPPRLVQALGPGFVRTAKMDIPITHAAGELLIAGVYWNETATAIVVSDAFGSTWNALPAEIVPTGCDECGAANAQLFVARATRAGANVISVNQQAGVCPLGMFVLDYAGLSTDVRQGVGAKATGSATEIALPALNVDRDSILVGMYADGHDQGDIAVGSDFHVVTHDGVWYAAIAVSALVPAGSYSPTATLPAGHDDACWVGTAVAFHP